MLVDVGHYRRAMTARPLKVCVRVVDECPRYVCGALALGMVAGEWKHDDRAVADSELDPRFRFQMSDARARCWPGTTDSSQSLDNPYLRDEKVGRG